MKLNTVRKAEPIFTHGGARAAQINAEQQLRRSVMSCLLWEKEFYEEGQTIADRIVSLASGLSPAKVASIAIEAHQQQKLRHAPLLLLSVLADTAKGTSILKETIPEVVTRPDSMAELLVIHAARLGVGPDKLKSVMTHQLEKGLAAAFQKFDSYQLAKYNRDGAVKLRDVLFLAHAKPTLATTELATNTLDTPDTWEVALSSGANKKDTWERLLREGNLGYLALLRNLRNMDQAGVDKLLIRAAIMARKGAHNVLPFQFINAAKYAPWAENDLDQALQATLWNVPKLPGHTTIVVDVSGSMGQRLSAKSELTRMDAAASLTSLLTGVTEESSVWLTAGSDSSRIHKTEMIASRVGQAMVDQIRARTPKLGGGGIFLTPVLRYLQEQGGETTPHRLIVITDEQDCTANDKDKPSMAKPFGKNNYMLNVASARNGIGYGKWTHIDGFSENVIRYIAHAESNQQ